jgi:hypothetical protein
MQAELMLHWLWPHVLRKVSDLHAVFPFRRYSVSSIVTLREM